MSYEGKLKEYLECNVESIPDLAQILERKSKLRDAMDGIERLVELHPSEMQREAANVQWRAQMKQDMDQGRRNSIFEGLFTNQYILYGRSSLTPVHIGEGATHLSEIPMKSLSVETELPILDIVDPVGLKHMLFQFRFEQREQK